MQENGTLAKVQLGETVETQSPLYFTPYFYHFPAKPHARMPNPSCLNGIILVKTDIVLEK
jgi:hypothetical protein